MYPCAHNTNKQKPIIVEPFFVRSPLFHRECDLTRGVASFQGEKSIHSCLVVHQLVASQEGFTSRQDGLSKGVPLYNIKFHSTYPDVQSIYQ